MKVSAAFLFFGLVACFFADAKARVNSNWETQLLALGLPAHVGWARLMNLEIEVGNGITQYKNNNITVIWGPYSDANQWISITDCSGWATALIQNTYDFLSASGHIYAFTYYDLIEAGQSGWTRVPTVSSARAGDFITIRYPYDPTMANVPHDTGHVAMINGPPVLNIIPLPPIVHDTRQWIVPVLDQTSTPHGATDSRYSRGLQGLGTGYLRIYVSASNNSIVGYTWDPLSSSSPFISALESNPQTLYGLNIGRLNID